ncbi:uncharacterized protein LOC129727531 [Wyeomyia smithii]|uniref:uncharacterized protein LOC129727531 n=1 Tax=Wyeomyia smithii TaxID=174621 RepID=UPI002467D03F|nr:uncharacterized protein LOC129727531 [Wyeomyia smithii]
MSHCRVISCLNKRGQTRFFSFPTDPKICAQWVQFCRCPETEDRFKTKGVKSMQKMAICSEHFEPDLLQAAARGQLPPDAVPIDIGRTYMTPAMLIEHGFNIELQTEFEAVDVMPVSIDQTFITPDVQTNHDFKVESQTEPEFVEPHVEDAYISDNFLVEMLRPEDIKEEPNEDEQSNFVDDAVAQDDNHTNTPTEPASQNSSKNKDHISKTHVAKKLPCEGLCVLAPNFKKQLMMQEKGNQKMKNFLQDAEKRYTTALTRVRKTADLLVLKHQKRIRLKIQYKQLQAQNKMIDANMSDHATESEDEGDFDETKAWW